MLHQDEWSISTTHSEFPLLSVLCRNLLVNGMTSLLIVHVPHFIHSCITLRSSTNPKPFVAFSSLDTWLSFRGILWHFLNIKTLKNPEEHRPILAVQACGPLTFHQLGATLVVATTVWHQYVCIRLCTWEYMWGMCGEHGSLPTHGMSP